MQQPQPTATTTGAGWRSRPTWVNGQGCPSGCYHTDPLWPPDPAAGNPTTPADRHVTCFTADMGSTAVWVGGFYETGNSGWFILDSSISGVDKTQNKLLLCEPPY